MHKEPINSLPFKVLVVHSEKSGPLTPSGAGAAPWPQIACAGVLTQRKCLIKAVDAAKQQKCTHVVICDHSAGCLSSTVNALVLASRRHPHAVVIGTRSSNAQGRSILGRVGGRLDRLLVRLQTGISISDPASPLRIYPLAVLRQLAPKAKGATAARVLLVKSAWGGVTIEETPIQAVAHGSTASRGEGSLIGIFQALMINMHWTARAMVPWPHERIESGPDATKSRISILRPVQSIGILLAENASPGQLAWAGAMGVFIGALPIFGFHTVTILLTANFFRLNKVAAAAASTLCTPPFVPAFCIELGYYLRHGRFLTEVTIQTLWYEAVERLYEWLLGSLIIGPLLAAIVGVLIFLIAAPIARRMALSKGGESISGAATKLPADLPGARRGE